MKPDKEEKNIFKRHSVQEWWDSLEELDIHQLNGLIKDIIEVIERKLMKDQE